MLPSALSIIKTWCKNPDTYTKLKTNHLELESDLKREYKNKKENIVLKTRVYILECSNTEHSFGKWMGKVEPYMQTYRNLKKFCINIMDVFSDETNTNSISQYSIYINDYGIRSDCENTSVAMDDSKPIEIAICLARVSICGYVPLQWIDELLGTKLAIADKTYELLYLEFVITPDISIDIDIEI